MKDSLEQITPYLINYRVFYDRPSDEKGAKEFLEVRFDNAESNIFIALFNETGHGIRAVVSNLLIDINATFFILNDLYENTSFR